MFLHIHQRTFISVCSVCSERAAVTPQKLRARALLVDLDGTLVDSVEAFEAAAKAALTAFGCSQGSDNPGLEIAKRLQRNLPLDDFFDENCVDVASREKFLKFFLQSFYSMATSMTRLLPGVDKTLDTLSKSFLLALVTRRLVSSTVVEKELGRLGLDRYFRVVVTALDVVRSTPFPDAVLKAAEELGVPVGECVVVSDSGVDIRAGKCTGAKTVAVLSGLFGREELEGEKPDLILEDINCLPERLLAK